MTLNRRTALAALAVTTAYAAGPDLGAVKQSGVKRYLVVGGAGGAVDEGGGNDVGDLGELGVAEAAGG